MALGAQAMAMATSIEEQVAEAALAGSPPAVVLIPAGGGGGGEGEDVVRLVDPALFWGDEGRVKRELVAWAKAVASMAVHRAALELRRSDYRHR